MTFLVNLKFCRLDKSNEPIFGVWAGVGVRVKGGWAYIRDVNWVTFKVYLTILARYALKG